MTIKTGQRVTKPHPIVGLPAYTGTVVQLRTLRGQSPEALVRWDHHGGSLAWNARSVLTPIAAPVAVGDAIIVAESYRGGRKDYRATIVKIIDHGGPGQRPIYNAEFVRGKGIAVLWREEFTLA